MSYPEGKMFSVRLLERDFTNPIILPPVKLIPERYSWNSIGGPLSADISVNAIGKDSRAILELLEYLRCPIEIFDHNQMCVWWGFIDEVEINIGSVSLSVSLDSMSNRIAALYETDTKQKAVTSWVQNDDSVGVYGEKQLLITSTLTGQSAAEYFRNEVLNNLKKPISQISFNDGNGEISARITGRGWWKTLEWKYYSAAAGSAVETTTQIANIITTSGQFFTGTEIKDSSGFSIDPYRAGDNNALFEIETLLAAGTNTGFRLLSSVGRARDLIVYKEPVLSSLNDIELFMRENGQVENYYANRNISSLCPVGLWMRLKDVIPGSLDLGLVSDPTVLFVEEASFEVATERYIPIARGQGSPFGIGTKISEG